TDAFARARIHRDRADALMALALKADPATIDLRSPSYVTDRGSLADAASMRALARDVEADLAAWYLVVFDGLAASGGGTPPDRAWLVTGAFDALVASVMWGDLVAADLEPFPGLTIDITGTDPAEAPSPSASPIETISPTPLP
ncbi:MAG: ferritin family protein, partial [Candidatus Limnocylindrales bacterium]